MQNQLIQTRDAELSTAKDEIAKNLVTLCEICLYPGKLEITTFGINSLFAEHERIASKGFS